MYLIKRVIQIDLGIDYYRNSFSDDSACALCVFVSASLLGLSHNSCKASKAISIMIIILVQTHIHSHRQMEDPATVKLLTGETVINGDSKGFGFFFITWHTSIRTSMFSHKESLS